MSSLKLVESGFFHLIANKTVRRIGEAGLRLFRFSISPSGPPKKEKTFPFSSSPDRPIGYPILVRRVARPEAPRLPGGEGTGARRTKVGYLYVELEDPEGPEDREDREDPEGPRPRPRGR